MIQHVEVNETRTEGHPAPGSGGTAITVSRQMELILPPASVPGWADRIRARLREAGIELLAASPYAEGQSRQWLVVVDDALGAIAILHEFGLACDTDSVLVVEASIAPAQVALIGAALQGEGIGIRYAYVSPNGRGRVRAVFKTTDEDRALEVLTGSTLPNQCSSFQPRRSRP